MIKTYEKHPDSILDYGFDLTRWLSEGESIVTVEADIDSGDIVEVATDTDGKRASAFLSGGTNKTKSFVTVKATTNNAPVARVFARTIAIYVTDSVQA